MQTYFLLSHPMQQHTKGPWVYSKQERRYEQDHDGTYKPFLIRDEETRLNFIGLFDGLHGTEANARLIAAAPELLDACKAMLEWARRGETKNAGPEILLATNAVAKAEGSPSSAA
jgi:hypothetical protein